MILFNFWLAYLVWNSFEWDLLLGIDGSSSSKLILNPLLLPVGEDKVLLGSSFIEKILVFFPDFLLKIDSRAQSLAVSY